MKSIIENKERCGNFTSSPIVALTSKDKAGTGWGKPALTYIQEKNMERRLGRSLSNETDSRETNWGKLMEPFVFDSLGLDYKLCSQETITHPDIPYWCGSPDGLKYNDGLTVFDIKNPFTLKSFCLFADCLNIEEVREKHPDGEKYYWQLISNAILTGAKYGELIFHVPYKSQLPKIRDLVVNEEGFKNNWIIYAKDSEIPYLNDNGYYKNISLLNFEIPQADKDLLTERVLAAGKLLITT